MFSSQLIYTCCCCLLQILVTKMVRERNNNSPLEKVRKTIQAPASDHFVGNLSLTVPKGERFGFNRTKLDTIIGILGEDNFVYRFRILIQRDGVRTNFSEDLRVNVMFLENDSIDCRLYVNLGKLNFKILKFSEFFSKADMY